MPDPLRQQLLAALDWGDARVRTVDVFADVPPALRGRRPEGLPYSLWQLLEHIRRAQRDLLEFCRDAEYRAGEWPDDYWPDDPGPPEPDAWEKSLGAYRTDRRALRELLEDPSVELTELTPTGSGEQTLLRSLLLVIDHTSYHAGQAVAVRRLLGIWPPAGASGP